MKEKEPVWFRKLDANNPDDIKIYKTIEQQPGVSEWMGKDDMQEEEIKELLSDEEQIFYGVCAEKGANPEAWISLYEPEQELIERLIEQKLIDASKNKKILEISFARYINPELSTSKKGLISSAVRQICSSLMEKQEKPLIIAFTDPENLRPEGVLNLSGFVVKGKIKYEKDSLKEDKFWVLDKSELEKILENKKQGVV